jgi:hypothetical protein
MYACANVKIVCVSRVKGTRVAEKKPPNRPDEQHLVYEYEEEHPHTHIHACMHIYVHTYVDTYIHTYIKRRYLFEVFVYAYIGCNGCRWDYNAALIPSALTADMEAEQERKAQEKKEKVRVSTHTKKKEVKKG